MPTTLWKKNHDRLCFLVILLLHLYAKLWRGLWPTGCFTHHVIDSIASAASLLHALLNHAFCPVIAHLHSDKLPSCKVNEFSLCGLVLRAKPAMDNRQPTTYGGSAVDAFPDSYMAPFAGCLYCTSGTHAELLRGHLADRVPRAPGHCLNNLAAFSTHFADVISTVLCQPMQAFELCCTPSCP